MKRYTDSMTVQIKRIYDEPAHGDGFRILVDRIWPRGISKDRAALDEWLKDVAPSTELRQWFAHDPVKFTEFRHRYEKELATNATLTKLQDLIHEHDIVTLLYSAHDVVHNQAVVLRDYLQPR